MKRTLVCLIMLLGTAFHQPACALETFPEVADMKVAGYFPLAGKHKAATILIDPNDERVVHIAASLLADDVEALTGIRPGIITYDGSIPDGPCVIAGTAGRSGLIDRLSRDGLIDASILEGKWESYLIQTVSCGGRERLVIAGSDRRGTAFGLTSLCEAAGVSPWYWWADVTTPHRNALYVQPGLYLQKEPAVQYRGIFLNDERFGGWARWVENTFDKDSGEVGPKVYAKVFELLLRLRANYLWPAMHNGSKAFNANPENARLAEEYAIVMGSSHCEQMLRNNEDEWKNAGTWGDFNFITNHDNMIRYWEERVQANGKYENIYTLGLRGIHDYPMEGANSTQERMKLMQKAIDEQRDILRRNIDRPVEEIPQILCTYEEVLDAYHAGLQIPDDVTLLWSDDKHGYTRNLCNPEEMKRRGGAGIYYHLSYHGDPASWIWLSPLSPSFISAELTKAYSYGARKIWIFNVGDIKPAEKEISFVMDLAWDIDRWAPEKAGSYIETWAERTFGKKYAKDIALIQEEYYRLQASGKDSHVYFLEYSEEETRERLNRWETVAKKAEKLRGRMPDELKAAYFELVEYPVRGAWMLNEYQLLSRLSMAHASFNDAGTAMADAARATEMYHALNEWTDFYNKELLGGKWDNFFNWQPYHWFRSTKMDAPICTEQILTDIRKGPGAAFAKVEDALSNEGAVIFSDVEGDIPLWIHALTPTRNASKEPEDNKFCTVCVNGSSLIASAKPINNIWHSPLIGPMWSKVGTIHLKKGENRLNVRMLEASAHIDNIFLGLYPPFPNAAATIIKASEGRVVKDSEEGRIRTIKGLGFNDGVTFLPFDTPSYNLEDAPSIAFTLDIPENAEYLEIRTLADLHLYEGRDARYAVSIDGKTPEAFSIHTDDFSAEWRWNVLRGYASRTVSLSSVQKGTHRVVISFLDPGIVLQELRIAVADKGISDAFDSARICFSQCVKALVVNRPVKIRFRGRRNRHSILQPVPIGDEHALNKVLQFAHTSKSTKFRKTKKGQILTEV